MKLYSGINIQWPISELILSGKKTIETRTYPLPKKYINKELAMIETPGPKGKFKARTVAIIKFTNCFIYKSQKEFYEDIDRHCVTKKSPWAWTQDKPKWGWEIVIIEKILPPKECNSIGIIYRSNVKI